MHALLALAASHREKLVQAHDQDAGVRHGAAALKGLNWALTKAPASAAEGDAIVATCYALMMRSWFMDDGLQSFIVLLRSSAMVEDQVRQTAVGSTFAERTMVGRANIMARSLADAPRYRETFTADALSSLASLQTICTDRFQRDLVHRLIQNADSLARSPLEGMTDEANRS